METNNIKCPSCGAELTYDPEGTSLTCEYCGAKVQLTNDPEILKLKQEQARWRASQEKKKSELQEAEEKYVKSAAFRMKLIIVSAVIFFISYIAIRKYPDNTVFKAIAAVAFVVAIFAYLELSRRKKKLDRWRQSYTGDEGTEGDNQGQ